MVAGLNYWVLVGIKDSRAVQVQQTRQGLCQGLKETLNTRHSFPVGSSTWSLIEIRMTCP